MTLTQQKYVLSGVLALAALLCLNAPLTSAQTTATAISQAEAGTRAGSQLPPPDPVAPAAGVAAAPEPAQAENATVGQAQLPPFYALRSCVAFNILVVPPAAGAGPSVNGTLTLEADPNVIAATQVTIANEVLAVSMLAGFETNKTIKLTITTPDATSLRYVQNFGIGDVVVGPGFSPPDFSASATSIGHVIINNITTPKLRVVSNGATTVYVSGAFNDTSLNVGGTSKVYLVGQVGGAVNINAAGITTTYIQATPTTTITGSAEGLAKILYTDGTCSAPNPLFPGLSIFGDPCTKVSTAPPAFTPAWTCGVLVDGRSECSAGSAAPAEHVPVEEGAQAPPPPPPQETGAATQAASVPPPSATEPQTTTVTGPTGTVTTTTFTSGPGASATSGGLVSGTGFPPFGARQEAAGGQPATVETVGSSGGGSSGSVAAGGGGGGFQTASSGQRSASVSNTANPPQALVDVALPVGSGGMSLVNVDCLDPYPQPMLPAGGA